MEETQVLYGQIVDAGEPVARLSRPPAEPVSLQEAMQQLKAAMRAFDLARDEMQQALRLVKRFERQSGTSIAGK